jgi:hypothetical protein
MPSESFADWMIGMLFTGKNQSRQDCTGTHFELALQVHSLLIPTFL